VNGATGGVAAFALCAPCGPATTLEATAYWDALGLDQLLFGEWPFAAAHRATLVPDVDTASDDWPCLEDVLQEAALRTAAGWLLVLPPDALPSADLIRAITSFVASGPGPHLVIGRAWRVSAEGWTTLRTFGPRPGQGDEIREVLRQQGTLDHPDRISWILLPRGRISGAPAHLSAEPQSAAAWLADRASVLGWKVLDATWAAPLLRARAADSSSPASQRLPIPIDGALPATDRVGPQLSFLLVGEPERLRCGLARLLPITTLPWEVVVREVRDPAHAADVIEAWNAALRDAQAELVWPLVNEVPRLGSVPTLLRCFQPPWVDLVTTATRIGTQLLPARDPTVVRPGHLVIRRIWMDRLGGFPAAGTPAHCLRRLRREGAARGALAHSLCLDVWDR